MPAVPGLPIESAIDAITAPDVAALYAIASTLQPVVDSVTAMI